MTHDNRRQGECQRVDKYKLKRIKIHGLIVVEHDEGYDQRSIDVIPLEVDANLESNARTIQPGEKVIGLIQNPDIFHVYAETEDGVWLDLGYDCIEDEYDRNWDKVVEETLSEYLQEQSNSSTDEIEQT